MYACTSFNVIILWPFLVLLSLLFRQNHQKGTQKCVVFVSVMICSIIKNLRISHLIVSNYVTKVTQWLFQLGTFTFRTSNPTVQLRSKVTFARIRNTFKTHPEWAWDVSVQAQSLVIKLQQDLISCHTLFHLRKDTSRTHAGCIWNVWEVHSGRVWTFPWSRGVP